MIGSGGEAKRKKTKLCIYVWLLSGLLRRGSPVGEARRERRHGEQEEREWRGISVKEQKEKKDIQGEGEMPADHPGVLLLAGVRWMISGSVPASGLIRWLSICSSTMTLHIWPPCLLENSFHCPPTNALLRSPVPLSVVSVGNLQLKVEAINTEISGPLVLICSSYRSGQWNCAALSFPSSLCLCKHGAGVRKCSL